MSSSTTGFLFNDEPPIEPRRGNKLHSSTHERRPLDHYPTPADLCDALVVGVQRLGLALPDRVVDVCGGAGAIRQALAVHGIDVALTDIAPQAYSGTDGYVSDEPLDATKIGDLRRAVTLSGARAIITNTPYGRLAQPIARNIVALVEAGELDQLALLHSALWAGAGERAPLFDSVTYTGRVDCLWRPIWIPGTNGGGTMPFSWHLWSRQPNARTVSITREQADDARRRADTKSADTTPKTAFTTGRATPCGAPPPRASTGKVSDHECGK